MIGESVPHDDQAEAFDIAEVDYCYVGSDLDRYGEIIDYACAAAM